MNNFFCFIHIEKCAGTTLHYSLKYNFPTYIILRPWYYWSNEPGNYFTAKELKLMRTFFPAISGIGGHTARTYAGYEKIVGQNIKYFTFVRNPFDRYLSHFNHQVRKGKDWTINSFLDEDRFNNYMTRRIAGSDDLGLAKKRIEQDYDFVGVFEHFDESLVMLNHFVFENKCKLYYEHKNMSDKKNELTLSDLNRTSLHRVEDNNKLDIELYEFIIKNVYEPNKIKVDNLKKKLDKFLTDNETYKYNRFKYLFYKSTKIYTDMLLQKIAYKFK